MSFLICKKEGNKYEQVSKLVVAGSANGIIKKLWEDKGCPRGGWRISVNEILNKKNYEIGSHEFIIDFHPNEGEYASLLKVENIYLWSYFNESDNSHFWTIMMIEMIDLENNAKITQKKDPLKFSLKGKPDSKRKIYTFLYLQSNWNWGRNGSTNGALIYPDAKKYFLQYLR